MAPATNRDAAALPSRYSDAHLLAQGGMGDIYTAIDTTLRREVAVKLLSDRFARDPELRKRFEREARAAARLSGNHHTIAIYDVGECEGRPYIVMEYVPGGTVADRLTAGPIRPVRALRWLDEAGAALDAAHARGVVHRDVKPANLLLTGDESIRVADFGIASAAGLTSLTAAGTVLGTVGYLAPEQAAGGTSDAAADRYALAVVAYELLTGRRPFDRGGNVAAEAVAAAREPVPPVGPELPASLDGVFRRALAPDPRERFPSCAAFVAALRSALDEDTAPAAVAAPQTYGTRRRRSPLPFVLTLLGLLAAAGAVAAIVLTRRSQNAAPPVTHRVVQTVTAQGSTVTVTTPAETAATPPASGGTDGAALNDQGYRLLQRGDYAGALPLLQRAVSALAGSNSTTEAYALYNLALARFGVGRCDGISQLLSQSEAIQGHRSEIDSLRRQVTARCGPR